MSQVQVMYVGLKPRKFDNVAGTGLTWHGSGDIQYVSANAWALLSRHPDVWREVTDAQLREMVDDGKPGLTHAPDTAGDAAPEGIIISEAAGKFMIATMDESGTVTSVCLDDVSDTALAEYARAAGIKGPALNKRGDNMRQAIVDAVNEKA